MPLNYSRWKHRITYSLSPVTTVSDRWVTLTLPWRVGINSDYSDLRFTDTAGNSLSYNIASKTDRVTATVKIEIPIAGTRLIHFYFGNITAASQSTAAGTEDSNPVLTAVSGTTNPGYSGAWTLQQGGRLNQQGYKSVNSNGPYPKWRYKALIKITNPVSTANYQHKLTLTWRPGMRADFRDIRFAQLNGKKCDYWIESYTDRTSAVVWIEVPTASQVWLNLYYGNGKAISESSGINTFEFFDDFAGDLSKWGNLGGATVSGGVATIAASSSAVYGIVSQSTYGTNIAVGARIYFAHYNTSSYLESFFANYVNDQNYVSAYTCHIGGATYYPKYDNVSGGMQTGVAMSGLSAGAYYNLECKKLASSAVWSVNGGSIVTNSGNYVSTAGKIRIAAYGNGSTILVDYVYARKTTTTEPSLTIVSHTPNSPRIIPYETLGTQPISGTTYVMDPIDFGLTVAGSIGETVLKPVIEFGHTIAGAIGATILKPVVDFGYTISGSVISRNYIALDQLDLTQISVSKAVTDDIWAMNATIDGFNELNTEVLRHATFATTDHLGSTQNIFAGILPKSSHTIKDAANKTTINGYDYAWYLSRQQVQTAYQHNTKTVNPADIITGILGGDDWEEITGISPYNINQVAGWGTTLNSKVFDFPIGTTKKQAIDKICNYCRYVFVVKWVVVDGIATPAAYFISEDDIDTELDLPDPVTFTYPDPYLADSINPVVKGDERYNRVTVIGRDNAGGVFTATVESPSVTAGDELAVEFIENSGSWTTQVQVTARAAELYAYYSAVAYTYTAKLIDRMDLELLQKIKITGYTGVSENWMRITRIKKTVRATNEGTEKTVEIEFTENVKWSALRRMYRYSSDDMTNEIETIVDSKIGQMPGMQVGTATAIDGQEATITLEDGTVITTRCV